MGSLADCRSKQARVDVARNAGLYCRLASSEEIVDDADARIDVLPVQDTARAAKLLTVRAICAPAKRNGGIPPAGWRGPRLGLGEEPVPAYARIDRQPSHRPLVLREERALVHDREAQIKGHAQGDADGVDVAVGEQTVVRHRTHVSGELLC